MTLRPRAPIIPGEYVPLLLRGSHIMSGVNLGTRAAFGDIAVSIAEAFGIEHHLTGRSFLNQIIDIQTARG